MLATTAFIVPLMLFLALNAANELSIPADCQWRGREILKEYADIMFREIGLPLILLSAISQCVQADSICDSDSYEWILLNVGGVYRTKAEHALAALIREHEETYKHAEEMPPLAAEQRKLDDIISNAQHARRLYDVGMNCKGMNAHILRDKVSTLEINIFSKTNEIQVENRRLRGRLLQVQPAAPSNFELEEEATCPSVLVDHHAGQSD
jgi:hypothetical protein